MSGKNEKRNRRGVVHLAAMTSRCDRYRGRQGDTVTRDLGRVTCFVCKDLHRSNRDEKFIRPAQESTP